MEMAVAMVFGEAERDCMAVRTFSKKVGERLDSSAAHHSAGDLDGKVDSLHA